MYNSRGSFLAPPMFQRNRRGVRGRRPPQYGINYINNSKFYNNTNSHGGINNYANPNYSHHEHVSNNNSKENYHESNESFEKKNEFDKDFRQNSDDLGSIFNMFQIDPSEALFDFWGFKVYFDDVLIICLLLFLYQEEVDDIYLFISLVLLLIN